MIKRLIDDDRAAFTLTEVIEVIFTLSIGLILAAVMLPIAFTELGAVDFSPGGVFQTTTGDLTSTGRMWTLLPTLVMVVLIAGLVYAVIGWFGGMEQYRRGG